ncbi:MAG TPA: hypothetical protein VMZ53_16665 [Kofleriaceae bacterium]|nr:hypothetical protein [Kofleriaceae bacterium]
MSKKPSAFEELKARFFAKLNIAIVTGNNRRVSVGNKGTVTLEDNQPIKE